jgi:DegV family protein with EDD domain
VRRVAVVTDSTAALDADEAARLGVTVVPLQVVVGDRAYADGAPAVSRLVADALRSGQTVTTSRPSPLVFLDAYRKAAGAGLTEVVSVHLSADLSGTCDAARLGGLQAPLPVTVVDSRQVGASLGSCVRAAADAAGTGTDAAATAAAATARAASTRTFLYVHTLEHLRRGGRIGSAQAVVGSALAVKPLLQLVDGRIDLLTKVRTSGRAIAELERRTVDAAGGAEVEVSVQHLCADDRAEALADRLRERIPALVRIDVREAGSVIGAHAGPGMLAVVVAPTVPPGVSYAGRS